MVNPIYTRAFYTDYEFFQQHVKDADSTLLSQLIDDCPELNIIKYLISHNIKGNWRECYGKSVVYGKDDIASYLENILDKDVLIDHLLDTYAGKLVGLNYRGTYGEFPKNYWRNNRTHVDRMKRRLIFLLGYDTFLVEWKIAYKIVYDEWTNCIFQADEVVLDVARINSKIEGIQKIFNRISRNRLRRYHGKNQTRRIRILQNEFRPLFTMGELRKILYPFRYKKLIGF